MLNLNTIYNGNTLDILKSFPDESINCCVTSPPYWGLRDYGNKDQIGLEDTPEEYINKIVEIFREIKRILKEDGTAWLNLGDSYAGSGRAGKNKDLLKNHLMFGKPKSSYNSSVMAEPKPIPKGLKGKDLVGIPWRVAFALQADGWYLRQDIIWHKPNPMPESITDRCTKNHEYIFLLSKSKKYYFDANAIKEPCKTFDNSIRNRDITKLNNTPGRTKMGGLKTNNYEMKNKRSVWTVTTKPCKEAHFAVFPQDLIEPCILAGCPEGGIVLDPFIGSGTTGVVSKKLNRNYVGIELNKDYVKIAEKRILNLK